LLAVAICGLFIGWNWGWYWASPVALPGVLLFLLFQDPHRDVPPLPLAVVAPIDGRIVEIAPDSGEILPGQWTRILISTNHFGAYTVRSPIEGTILDVRRKANESDQIAVPGGLWVRSEEQDDVVLLFPSDGPGLAPKAFVRYGERVGQGQRFAYLRLAPRAEVYLPSSAQVCVPVGARVHAGTSVLANLAQK